MVGDFITCLLAFFNIFIYFFIIFLLKKQRGPERGPEGGPKKGPKGESRREGPRFVYTSFQIIYICCSLFRLLIFHINLVK